MPAPSTPLLDTFTRADEDPLAGVGFLGPTFAGGSQMRLVSNAAVGRVGTDANSYWRTVFARDQEVSVTLKQKWSGSNINLALFLNFQAPNTAGASGYICAAYTAPGGNDQADIYRVDAVAFTQLGGASGTIGPGGTVANGSRFWAQNVGGVLSFYHLPPGGVWTLIMSRTDATYGAGLIGCGADDQTLIQDDFGGGAVGSVSRMLAVF